MLEMVLDGDDSLPQTLEDSIKTVQSNVRGVVELIKLAHHNYDSREILKEVGDKIQALNAAVEDILSEMDRDQAGGYLKNTILQVHENVTQAIRKMEEGTRLLDTVRTESSRQDIYKGLWKELEELMDKSGRYLDMVVSAVDRDYKPELFFKMAEGKKRMDEAKQILAKARADREDILLKIEAKTNELVSQSENVTAAGLKLIPEEDSGILTGASEGIKETVQKIREVRNMLGIEHSFEKPTESIKALEIFKDVVSFFKSSKRFFKQYHVAFDKVEILSREAENLFMKADDPAFRFALYNVLSLGLSGDKEDKRILDPGKKKIDISADRNGTTGEVIFTFRNNYYSFAAEDLEEVDLGGGEKGPSVLKWKEGGPNNPLAQAHKILSAFAGRLTIRSDENGSSLRIFMPYTEGAESIAEEKNEKEEVSREKEKAEDKKEEKPSGWPEEIIPGRPNIVIVDDEPVVGKMLSRILEADEYNIWLAEDGIDALDTIERMKAEEIDVHLGLFDISMPRMDGVVLIRTVREKKYDFPILVMTGHGNTNPKVQQLDKDELISGIVPKPFSMDDIKRRIRKLVETAALPKNEKALELQLASADKVALVYGENTEQGIRKLRLVGFQGEVRIAKNEEDLKDFLTSGEQFDFIVNTTKEDIKDLLKRIFSEFEAVPEVVDAEDMQLQSKLITICA